MHILLVEHYEDWRATRNISPHHSHLYCCVIFTKLVQQRSIHLGVTTHFHIYMGLVCLAFPDDCLSILQDSQSGNIFSKMHTRESVGALVSKQMRKGNCLSLIESIVRPFRHHEI